MKKVISAIICVLLSAVFVLASCGGKNDGNKEYTIDRQDGCNLLTVYYNRDTGYDDVDIWLWYGSVNGRGYAFHPCEYGGKVMFNIPDSITEVSFIIRTNCPTPGNDTWVSEGKDATTADRVIKMDGDTVIYLKSGDASNYISSDGGKTLIALRNIQLADLKTLKTIQLTISDGSEVTKDKVTVKQGTTEVAVSSVTKNLITLASAIDLSKPYTVSVEGIDDPVGVVPVTYFSSTSFENEYTYTGELGVILSESSTEFRLWAPTASEVKLNLFNAGNGGDAYKTVELTRGERGVWSYTENANLNGKYYTYTVTTSIGTQEAVDPYARSAGLNGARGMILDLDSTDPEGWVETPFDNPDVVNYTDAEIWEVHVRDFSNKITDSKLNSSYKGKYLAFTVEGLKNSAGLPVGIDYLKELGITHVHLLPSYDYASVDESKSTGFNWGYDPENYNVPEGSYSTDPTRGEVRVNEYKQMVQALHNAGISVVMDVVYNHTYSLNSNLNKVVPYYYYRYGSDGSPSNGSGCGNETASERSMMRKYMVDSVSYWQNEYNLDGFRFDLMGVHDITTMQEIEKAVHARNPEALIYGEGWTGGTVALDESQQGILANLSTLNDGTSSGVNGIAMFNDVIRDGLKGSVFSIDDTGFATGARTDYIDKILFGVTGSYNVANFGSGNGWFADNPTQVINYASAHDNNTLWDRICYVYGEGADTLEKRTAMNRLTAAIVQTSLGIPFMQAGEEMLRAKKNADGTYNENSYNASDDVNNLDWSLLTSTSAQYQTMQYYKGLIEFRKSCETLRLTYAAKVSKRQYVCTEVTGQRQGAFVAFTMTNLDTNEKLLVIYNANETSVNFTLPSGSWDLYVDGTRAGTQILADDQSGAKTFDALSCYVYKLDVKA